MMKQNRDWKLVTIAVLIVLLLGVGSWIGYSFYQAKQQGLVLRGFQQGQLQGQMNVINSVQTTGYFAFNVQDEAGQPQQVVLVGQLATPQQIQQLQQQSQAQQPQQSQ